MKIPDSLLASALDTVAEASLITDADQLIVYANAMFLSTTGYASEEVIGRNCRFLQDDTTDRLAVAAMRTALDAQTVYRRKDGSLFTNSITVSPIRDEGGDVSHYVSIQTVIPSPPASPDADTDAEVDAELRPTGLGAGAIEMFMQPIVDMTTGEPVIVESLARLRTPEGDIVVAAAFVPTLSMAELDELFVTGLDQSLESLARWVDTGLDVCVSVNLDPITLMNPSFVEWVGDALQKHGVEPARLILELLETRAVGRDEQKAAIEQVRELGVKLAIDDLGSGHSSLERVALYDFDVVKIDSGILAGLAESPLQTLSVISALTQLSVNLDRDAVVEGLETIDMVGVAVVLGARLGQGYLFAHPMPADEIPAWAEAHVRGFDSRHLTTYAAVLAYHWRHSRHAPHPGESADCPITRFLTSVESSAPVERWHATQHGLPLVESEDDARQLMNWLADRVAGAPTDR